MEDRTDPEAKLGPEVGGERAWLPLAVLLFVLPAAHPVLRMAGVGVASHLLWLVHVLPVALVAYRAGRRFGLVSVAASAAAILLGERLFGAGYGRAAPWETAISLAVSVAFAELLVGEFARQAREARDRQARSAESDALTGLPNRRGLKAAMARTIRAAAGEGERGRCCGVLFLDLDRFKRVNDSLGHSVGDEVLYAAARRFSRALRPEDLLARVGGDEFVVVLADLESANNALAAARRMTRAVNGSFSVGDREIELSVSGGVAVYPDDARELDELVRLADQAMYGAEVGKVARH